MYMVFVPFEYLGVLPCFESKEAHEGQVANEEYPAEEGGPGEEEVEDHDGCE